MHIVLQVALAVALFGVVLGIRRDFDVPIGTLRLAHKLHQLGGKAKFAGRDRAAGLVAAQRGGGPDRPRVGVVGAIAFVFSLFTIYGCGATAVLYGLMLLLLGLPVYVWQRRQATKGLKPC